MKHQNNVPFRHNNIRPFTVQYMYEAHIIYDFFIFDIISPAMRMDKPNFGSGGPPVGAAMWVANGATFEFTAMQ